MYKAVHDEGKYVFIHSCGDVDELFDDLIDIGVNCFNPFQPEVMDVLGLIEKIPWKTDLSRRIINSENSSLRNSRRRLRQNLKSF